MSVICQSGLGYRPGDHAPVPLHCVSAGFRRDELAIPAGLLNWGSVVSWAEALSAVLKRDWHGRAERLRRVETRAWTEASIMTNW